MKLTRSERFIRIVEFSPPRGAEPDKLLRDAAFIRERVDFVAITHNPGGKPRMDSHYASGILKRELAIEPICHFRILDGNRIDLYGKLMATRHLGVENLLVIRGDCPSEESFPDFCTVTDYRDSSEFIADIACLNRGEPTEYIRRMFTKEEIEKNRSSFKTDFCIGAAAHPYIPLDRGKNDSEVLGELETITQKVRCGADFLLTQILYDENQYLRYRDAVYEHLEKCGIKKRPPIIPGFLPILSLNTVNFLEDVIREVSIPEPIKKTLSRSSDPKSDGIKIAREVIQKMKEAGAPGVNVFSRTSVENIFKILEP